MANIINESEITMDVAAQRLELLTDAGRAVMLWGSPGIGKTDIVHQLGLKKNRKVLEFHAALRETVDLRGIPVANLEARTTDWLVPDELPQADRDGEFGYLFCDEINQANAQMQGALGNLTLYGTIGNYRLPKGWRVIAAGNRVSDRAAAQRMPTHLRNRFAHLYCVAELNAYCRWANAHGIPVEAVAWVRARSGENNGKGVLHIMPKGDENAFPTPRSISHAAAFVNAPVEHRMGLFASLIGDAYAADLEAYIELYRSLGSLDDIVADPDGAKLPTEASSRYAVCTGLGRIATKKTFPNIVKYAKRLNHRESEILVVTDATARDESLKNTAIYGKWAVENADLTMQ
jgi:hypothetical protein